MPNCLNGSNDNPCTLYLPRSEILTARVRTHNFENRDYVNGNLLPGEYLVNEQCGQQCRDIENNVKKVANFFEQRLEHRFICSNLSVSENRPEAYKSSINIRRIFDRDDYTPCIAVWHPTYQQALFGQRQDNHGNFLRDSNGHYLSYGTDLTIVAHEFCHGYLQQLKKDVKIERDNQGNILEHKVQPLALEESLCDIFAILVCNFNFDVDVDVDRWEPLGSWQWDVGQNFHGDDHSLRALDTMTSLGEAININNLPSHEYHKCSLIHSHAFYRFMTTQNKGENLFDGDFAYKLFGAVIENLVSDTNFSGSRRAFEESADNIILKNDSLRTIKLKAISQAFDNVGISLPNQINQ